MDHLRVGFFSDTYYPYVSGVVRSMESFHQTLTAMGHRVYTFAPTYPGFEEDTEDVFRLPSLPIRRYPGLRLAIPYGSPVIWGTGPDVDVVHVHSPFAMGHAGAMYARRLKVPLMLTVHSIYEQYVRYAPFIGSKMERAMSGTSKLAVRSYLVSYANSCAGVIAPSRYVANLLAEWGVEVPISVVPTGVAPGFSQQGQGIDMRARWQIPCKAPLWLAAGRLAPEKRFDFVLQAFACFTQQWQSNLAAGAEQEFTAPPALLIVGDGPERSALQAWVERLHLQGRVWIVGSVATEEIPACYRTADLLVHAGESETQGLVIAEAVTCGLPVLTVTDGALSEAVQDGFSGLLAPRQVEPFAATALQYFADADLRRRLRHGTLQAAPSLGAEAASRRLLGAYAQALATASVLPVE